MPRTSLWSVPGGYSLNSRTLFNGARTAPDSLFTETRETAHTASLKARAAHDASCSLQSLEGLFEVEDHILSVLDTHREAHEVLPDPEPLSARRRELTVRGGGRMDGERVDIAQRRGLYTELERVEESVGRLTAFCGEFERDESAGVREHAPCGFVIRMCPEGRMIDLRHLGMGSEAGCDLARVLAL